jgi:hypothetical protein
VFVEELDGAQGLFEEAFRIALDVFHEEEILPQVGLGEDVGGLHEVFGELEDVVRVTLAGAFGQTLQGHIVDELLAKRGHNSLRETEFTRGENLPEAWDSV